jgi:hypothetical protein
MCIGWNACLKDLLHESCSHWDDKHCSKLPEFPILVAVIAWRTNWWTLFQITRIPYINWNNCLQDLLKWQTMFQITRIPYIGYNDCLKDELTDTVPNYPSSLYWLQWLPEGLEMTNTVPNYPSSLYWLRWLPEGLEMTNTVPNYPSSLYWLQWFPEGLEMTNTVPNYPNSLYWLQWLPEGLEITNTVLHYRMSYIGCSDCLKNLPHIVESCSHWDDENCSHGYDCVHPRTRCRIWKIHHKINVQFFELKL